ncbi:prolyl-tRNA synthetase associated domain-containing protein [Burkholderia sp. Ac-20365]|uniref:prolyl-tRNA synthetase associated domain-containing protein n=1 Tax=Burkholderia sp. Ac-20365 TaxID=2703897 RepID=UPI00197B367D|nr:prolyl-tRNA synthetase associated domain-containing protein [Burkholderia sp. Ac-20365]MBN3762313.1 prolyl-tRNA synthetase associated domain-containing protein [Burkholderia sp. Ac-20365]
MENRLGNGSGSGLFLNSANDSMLGKDDVLKLLEDRDIPFSFEEHDPVLNMAESGMLTLSVVGARCKNLLLQDKKGHYFLIVTTAAKSLDLARIAEIVGSKRLSFASADTLFELLGIRAGSLSPLALVNDETKRVRLVIDTELTGEAIFLFHPLENNASVSLSRSALDAFLRSIEHPADWLPLAARASD